MAKKPAYSGTEVSVSKSQDELRGLLVKFGADSFSFGEGRGWAGVEFIHADHLVRVRCPMRPWPEGRLPHRSAEESAALGAEREAKRVWRVLVWSVKARLVAVEEGLETFEQAFLSHLVDPATNRTVWQTVREPIEAGRMQIGGAGLPALGAGDR